MTCGLMIYRYTKKHGQQLTLQKLDLLSNQLSDINTIEVYRPKVRFGGRWFIGDDAAHNRLLLQGSLRGLEK